MAHTKVTPKKFEIPTLEEVYGSDTALIRPLFKSSTPDVGPRPETWGENEARAQPASPAAGYYADYLFGRQGTSVSEGGRSGQRGEAAGGRGSGKLPPPGTDGRPCGSGEAAMKMAKLNAIVVSPRQRGNPILKFVRNVPWEFGDVVADYVLGQTTCALFLSLRYHCLNQDYIHERLKALGQAFTLRVLLVQVDVKDPHHALKELAKICLLADCTLILAWSAEEAGRYLETYKSYENKPSDILKERVDQDFLSKVTDCLTAVKSVNKTDSVTLLSTFKSLSNMVEASREDLSLCPGLGPQKARRLYDVFHEPFLRSQKPAPGKPDM